MKKNKYKFKRTALISALLLELAGGAQAATIAVDGTVCTLADAITAANTDTVSGGCTAGSGDDVLDLDIAGSPFNLTNALPAIISNVTINANGATIQRDPGAADFAVLQFSGGSSMLNQATITGGNQSVNNYGAGIRADSGAAVEINHSTITGNNGGAVSLFNAGPSSINQSLIQNNTSNATAYYNGGITINGGDLYINNSTIAGNSNYATNAGGGGIYISDFAGAVNIGISNSTISGNYAFQAGGGISSKYYGSGIQLNLNSVTLVNNSSYYEGGGMANNGGDVAVSQSLISGNTVIAGGTDQWLAAVATYTTVDSYNIFGSDGSAGLFGVSPGAADIVPTESVADIFDANLTDNGGPTPTHALVLAGPAVDVVSACLLSTDQTLKPRPQDGFVNGSDDCDVGAVEMLNPDVIFLNGLNNEFW